MKAAFAPQRWGLRYYRKAVGLAQRTAASPRPSANAPKAEVAHNSSWTLPSPRLQPKDRFARLPDVGLFTRQRAFQLEQTALSGVNARTEVQRSRLGDRLL